MVDLAVISVELGLAEAAKDIRERGYTERIELAEILGYAADLIEKGHNISVPPEVLRVSARYVRRGAKEKDERKRYLEFAKPLALGIMQYERRHGATVESAVFSAHEQTEVPTDTLRSWLYGRR